MHNNKSLYLNIVKGFAIFIMIWSHVLLYSLPSNISYFDLTIGKIIGSFNMPILMLISGYLFYFSFSKRDLKELVGHRCKPLICSIVFYGTFHYFVTNGVVSVFNGDWVNLFSGEWARVLLFHFWFLSAVLISSIIVAIICKKIKRLWMQIILLILSSVIVFAMPGRDNCLFVYPFYVIGFYYGKYKEQIKKLNNLKYLSLLFFPAMMFFFQSKHFIYTTGIIADSSILGIIKINMFRWAIGFVGSLFVLTIIEVFYRLITAKNLEKNKKSILASSLNELGANSLQYYTVSVTIVSFWFNHLYKILVNAIPSISTFMTNNILLHNFVFTLIVTILFCVILYFVIKFINNTFLCQIFFGKSPQKKLFGK